MPSLQAARELVKKAAQPNAKIVLDVLHFFRSGGRVSELTAESLAKVTAVQLSDVALRHGVSLAHEARHLRTYPGDGTLDIEGFLRAIGHSVGGLPPASVEPMSDALERLSLAVVADRTMFTTLRSLHEADFTLTGAGTYLYQGSRPGTP